MSRVPADAWEGAPLCDVCGLEACEDHVPANRQLSSARPTRLVARRALELLKCPRPVEIVEGVAFAGCLSTLVAESGAGKTFVLLDLAAALSEGTTWHGRATHAGSVVYIGYEGDAISLRLSALHEAQRSLDHIYVVRAQDPLSPHVSRDGETPSIGEGEAHTVLDDIARELTIKNEPPIVLLIIDTVRASMTGSEDSSEHVSAYLRAVRRLMSQVPTAACLLAHHTGWQDGESQRKRERGSSAWRGNGDATVYLEAGEFDKDRGVAELTLQTLKIRDAEKPPPLHLTRRRVELRERDRFGKPLTSCVIERDFRTREDRESEREHAAAAAEREIDLQLLRVVREHPDISSQRQLSTFVGLRHAVVVDAYGRMVRAGFVTQPQQRQPYVLTAAGLDALGGSK